MSVAFEAVLPHPMVGRVTRPPAQARNPEFVEEDA